MLLVPSLATTACMALVAAADQGFIQLSCILLMNVNTLLQSHAAAIHTSQYYVVLLQATWVAFNNLHIQYLGGVVFSSLDPSCNKIMNRFLNVFGSYFSIGE